MCVEQDLKPVNRAILLGILVMGCTPLAMRVNVIESLWTILHADEHRCRDNLDLSINITFE